MKQQTVLTPVQSFAGGLIHSVTCMLKKVQTPGEGQTDVIWGAVFWLENVVQ